MKHPVTPTRTSSLSLLLAVILAISVVWTGACSGDESSPASPAGMEQPTTTGTMEQPASTSGTAQAAEYEDVTFSTEDGLTLSGRLYQTGPEDADDSFWSSESGVVLCHMYPTDQTSWDEVAAYLASNGLSVLTFDFRGYGGSEGSKDIQYIDRDAAAAVRFLGGAGAERVVLVGASMGGTASLKAAAELQVLSSISMAGVATLSAPVEFRGLSAEEATPQLVMPLLFIAAEGDVGAQGARDLERLSGGAGDLQIVSGNEHGTDLFQGPEAEQVWTLLLDFLQVCLPM